MKRMNDWLGMLLVAGLMLSACAPAAVVEDKMMEGQAMEEKAAEDSTEDMEKTDEMEPKTDEMSEAESDEMKAEDSSGEMAEEPHSEDMSEPEGMEAKSEDDMMEAPAWFNAELTDVRTGAAFTIQDYKGKVVLVENMAIWCSNCLRQQKQVKELKVLLGERDDFVSLGLDIDPNEDGDSLKSYTEQNGFEWTYAVAPADVAREISNLYGAQYLNPPSTPMFIIDRSGEVHLLPFGIKDAQSLLEALQPFLDEGM